MKWRIKRNDNLQTASWMEWRITINNIKYFQSYWELSSSWWLSWFLVGPENAINSHTEHSRVHDVYAPNRAHSPCQIHIRIQKTFNKPIIIIVKKQIQNSIYGRASEAATSKRWNEMKRDEMRLEMIVNAKQANLSNAILHRYY